RSRLVAMGRMPTIRDDTELSLTGKAFDAIDLFQRAVFVVLALYGKDGASDFVEVGLDVPGAERRVQPDVVPTPERGIHVLVIAAKLFRQIGRQVGLAGVLDVR